MQVLHPENHLLPLLRQLCRSPSPFPGQFPFVHTLPSRAKRLRNCGHSHSAAFGSSFSSDLPPVASEMSITVSAQLRHSLNTQQTLPVYFLPWLMQNTVLPGIRYSRVHVVLEGQDDWVERCFKGTFCNGLNGILNKRQWSEQRSALAPKRQAAAPAPSSLQPDHRQELLSKVTQLLPGEKCCLFSYPPRFPAPEDTTCS